LIYKLLFSPSGRIGPAEFMKGAIILIIVAILYTLPTLFGAPLAVEAILGLLSLVTLWCWVVLWVKRYHDAGKSGWTCLLPIIAFLVLVVGIVCVLYGSDFMEMFRAGINGADEIEIAEMEAALEKKTELPILIISTIVSLAIAFLFNKMIKQDTHDNQFGPHGTVAETFS